MNSSPSPLLDALVSHQVEFVVIGGHAVIFHGHLRTTEDLDVIIRQSPENRARLLAALREVHAQWIDDEIDPATGLERLHLVNDAYLRSHHLMMLFTRHGFLDIFDFIPGYPNAPVDDVFQSSVCLHGIHYASLHWLRQMKLAAGRHKDLADLESLPDDD